MSEIKNDVFTLGVANEGEINVKHEELITWKPSKVTHSTGSTLFEHDGKFYSMRFADYKEVFGR
jgi:hypothetical protein